MMNEQYAKDTFEMVTELQEQVASGTMIHDRSHRARDFERVRHHSYECESCRHHIGKQQMLILQRLEEIREILSAGSPCEVDQFNDAR